MIVAALVLALTSAPVAHPEGSVVFHAEANPAAAAERVEDENQKPRQWEFEATIYGWLTGASVSQEGGVIDVSFGEVLAITNTGFQARAGAEWRRKLRLSVDWTYGDVGDAIDIGLLTTDFNVQQHIVDARLGYNVHDTRAEDGWEGTVLSAEAGLRHWNNRTRIVTTSPFPELSGDELIKDDWTDFLIGARAHFGVTRGVAFTGHFAIGGFGIGSSSQFTWDAGGYAVFGLGDVVAIHGGYRALRYRREDAGVEMELTMTGLQFGVSLVF